MKIINEFRRKLILYSARLQRREPSENIWRPGTNGQHGVKFCADTSQEEGRDDKAVGKGRIRC